MRKSPKIRVYFGGWTAGLTMLAADGKSSHVSRVDHTRFCNRMDPLFFSAQEVLTCHDPTVSIHILTPLYAYVPWVHTAYLRSYGAFHKSCSHRFQNRTWNNLPKRSPVLNAHQPRSSGVPVFQQMIQDHTDEEQGTRSQENPSPQEAPSPHGAGLSLCSWSTEALAERLQVELDNQAEACDYVSELVSRVCQWLHPNTQPPLQAQDLGCACTTWLQRPMTNTPSW